MHIMDILQNSVRARSGSIKLDIVEDRASDTFMFSITDNGCGIPREIFDTVTDPYVTTRNTRHVGLGLSLLKQNAERTGGGLSLISEEGKGTTVTARFINSHLDSPSTGDLASAVLLTMTSNPGINFEYNHIKDNRSIHFTTDEVRNALGAIPMNEPLVYPYLLGILKSELQSIGVS